MCTKSLLAASFLTAMLVSGTASATLIGDTITANGIALNPTSATIGAGAEFNFVNLELFDFDASTLTISHPGSGGHGWGDFGYFVFSGFDDIITGLTLVSNTGYSGDPLSDYSFTDHSITLHWGNGGASPGAQMVFSIQSQATAVPEPALTWLFAIGLGALVVVRRRPALSTHA